MGVFNNECDVYFGVVGEASEITALTGAPGTFGTLIKNLDGRYAIASVGAPSVIRRVGPEPDAFDTFNFGVTIPQVVIQPRDISQTSIDLLFGALVTSGYISTAVGNFASETPKVQLWIKSRNSSLELFMPSASLSPGQVTSVLSWARRESVYAGQPLTLVALRPDGQTTPACIIGTNAQLTGVYFGS